MAFKDIIGTIFSVDSDEAVLGALEELAAGKAHATAVLIELQPDPVYTMEGVVVSSVWSEIIEQSRADFDKEKQKLDARCRIAPATPIETRSVLVSASLAGEEATMQARHVDLTVMLRPGASWPEEYRTAMFEAVLFGSGRPVLLMSPKWRRGAIGRNIVVGWNGKREAARAIGDAMPLLESADLVTVVTVDAHPDFNGVGQAPGADITAHLARHGVNAVLRNIDGLGREAGDALLAEARALEADLIVIGGYGKARLREWVFGGVTRTLTHTATMPVFMSH